MAVFLGKDNPDMKHILNKSFKIAHELPVVRIFATEGNDVKEARLYGGLM